MWAYGITKNQHNDLCKVDETLRTPSMGIHKIDVPIPRLKSGEVLVKVKASALNFNTLWSARSFPLSPFQLIGKYVLRNPFDKDHIQDFAIFGSDASGIITEVSDNVDKWKVGDEVVIHCNVVDTSDPIVQTDGMLTDSQAIWGYETNYGAFAEYTRVKATQLIKKPKHISWEVAASFCLTHSTAYRMLCTDNGIRIQPGDHCLVWGASGGLGTFATQLISLMGGVPVAIVSTASKEKICKDMGCPIVINLQEHGLGKFVDDRGEPNYMEWRKLKNVLEKKGAKKINYIFEHIGRNTLGVSIYLLEKGGSVVICAATSGYLATIDLRFLWMNCKSIVGSHFSNYYEASQAADLIFNNKIKPIIHSYTSIDTLPIYADLMYNSNGFGKYVFNHDLES
jgi:crotonyl-CoA reductase